MRILVVTPTFLPVIGGAELGIHEIYHRLGVQHEIRILTPVQSPSTLARHAVEDTAYENSNYEVKRFRYNKNRGIRQAHFLSNTWRQVQEFQPDVVSFHGAIPSELAILFIRLFEGVPIVLSLIGRPDVLGPETPFFNKLRLLLSIYSAKRTICITKYMLRWPQKTFHANVIPYGVDTCKFSPSVDSTNLKNSLGIPQNKTILFTLQRLVDVKDVDILIKSLPYILHHQSNVLLIIGGKGPEETNLRQLAKSLNVDKNIIFAGYILDEKLPEYFAMTDLFLFSSSDETFGIVLVQAMAMAKPIVSVRATAVPEVVFDRQNALLVEPRNPEKFAEAVLNLLKDEHLRTLLASNNRHRAIEVFEWDSVAYQYEQVFSAALNNSNN